MQFAQVRLVTIITPAFGAVFKNSECKVGKVLSNKHNCINIYVHFCRKHGSYIHFQE